MPNKYRICININTKNFNKDKKYLLGMHLGYKGMNFRIV